MTHDATFLGSCRQTKPPSISEDCHIYSQPGESQISDNKNHLFSWFDMKELDILPMLHFCFCFSFGPLYLEKNISIEDGICFCHKTKELGGIC